jgi:isopenicillin N synthase-like dioxygenase
VVKTILSRVSDVCGLEGSRRFEHYHQDNAKSRSALYFLHHPPTDGKEGKGQNIHTDAGTLTLLFTKQRGLQVLSPTTNGWESVATKPGCAVVNVGDTLRFLSNQRFRSAMHRVLPPGTEDRYSTAYFLRAADNAVFKGNDGKDTTAEQWFLRKFYTFTLSREEQRKDSVAFGGMEKALGVTV